MSQSFCHKIPQFASLYSCCMCGRSTDHVSSLLEPSLSNVWCHCHKSALNHRSYYSIGRQWLIWWLTRCKFCSYAQKNFLKFREDWKTHGSRTSSKYCKEANRTWSPQAVKFRCDKYSHRSVAMRKTPPESPRANHRTTRVLAPWRQFGNRHRTYDGSIPSHSVALRLKISDLNSPYFHSMSSIMWALLFQGSIVSYLLLTTEAVEKMRRWPRIVDQKWQAGTTSASLRARFVVFRSAIWLHPFFQILLLRFLLF